MAFKKLLALAALAVVASTGSTSAQNAPFYTKKGLLQIGAVEALNVTAPTGANHEYIISSPTASYISVKFNNFALPEGDVVIVRSPDSSEGHIYTGKGRGDLGAFASSPIHGTTAIVEYYSLNQGAASSTAYRIEGYVRGFQGQRESICGAGDQTRPAKCFTSSLPTAYTRAKAVARLLIGGQYFCTGWLVGSDGHLMTNEHCITSAADAAQVDIEFNAEGASCSDLCATGLACPGTIAATSAQFITNSATIDYALLKLPRSVATTYGYLRLRSTGPRVGETIYIPQHPAGWGKRIATTVDGGASATIRFTGRSGTPCGNNQVGYLADTQGGSSGSPVLGRSDNLVVALHHCGGCENLAADVRTVISDLRAKSIVIPNLTA